MEKELQPIDSEDQEAMNMIRFLQQKIQNLEYEREYIDEELAEIKQAMSTYGKNFRNVAYRLYAMFTYSEGNCDRHWLYIYDWKKERWLKYSDSEVTEVNTDEITGDTPLANEIPYYLVYVDAEKIHELLHTDSN
jgi:hypothetical protein